MSVDLGVLLMVSGAAALAGLLGAPLVFWVLRRLSADANPAAQVWMWRAGLSALVLPSVAGLVFAVAPISLPSFGAEITTVTADKAVWREATIATAFAASPHAAPEAGDRNVLAQGAAMAARIGLAGLGAMVWLGLGVAAIAAVRDQRRLQAALRRTDAPPRPDIVLLAEAWRLRLGVERRPTLRVGPPGAAFLTGWRRPHIVLPGDLATSGDHERLAHVIAHELAHIRRADELTRPFDNVLRRLAWFNPVIRRMADRLSDAREAACDAQVVAAAPAERKRYARTVLTLATRADHSVAAACAFPPSNERTYAMRLQSILRPSQIPPAGERRAALARTTGLAACVAALGLTAAACATAGAQETAADEPTVHFLQGEEQRVRIIRSGADGEVDVDVDVDVVTNDDGSRTVRIIGPDGEEERVVELARIGEAGRSEVVIRTEDGEERFEWNSAELLNGVPVVRVVREDGVVLITDPETGATRTVTLPEGGAALEARTVVVRQAGDHDGEHPTAVFIEEGGEPIILSGDDVQVDVDRDAGRVVITDADGAVVREFDIPEIVSGEGHVVVHGPNTVWTSDEATEDGERRVVRIQVEERLEGASENDER